MYSENDDIGAVASSLVDATPPEFLRVIEVRCALVRLQALRRVKPPTPSVPLSFVVFSKNVLTVAEHRLIPVEFFANDDNRRAIKNHLKSRSVCIVPIVTTDNHFTVTIFFKNAKSTLRKRAWLFTDEINYITMLEPFTIMLMCWILHFQGYLCILENEQLSIQHPGKPATSDLLALVFGKNSFLLTTHEKVRLHRHRMREHLVKPHTQTAATIRDELVAKRVAEICSITPQTLHCFLIDSDSRICDALERKTPGFTFHAMTTIRMPDVTESPDYVVLPRILKDDFLVKIMRALYYFHRRNISYTRNRIMEIDYSQFIRKRRQLNTAQHLYPALRVHPPSSPTKCTPMLDNLATTLNLPKTYDGKKWEQEFSRNAEDIKVNGNSCSPSTLHYFERLLMTYRICQEVTQKQVMAMCSLYSHGPEGRHCVGMLAIASRCMGGLVKKIPNLFLTQTPLGWTIDFEVSPNGKKLQASVTIYKTIRLASNLETVGTCHLKIIAEGNLKRLTNKYYFERKDMGYQFVFAKEDEHTRKLSRTMHLIWYGREISATQTTIEDYA